MKFIAAVFLFSFFALPAWAGTTNPVSVEIVNQPSKAWRFSAVNAYPDDEAIRIKGHIVADRRFGLPEGHIDIAAYSPKGELVGTATAHYKPRMLRYRAGRKGKVRFATNLTDAPPASSAIRVAFHSISQRDEADSVHANTAIQ